MENYNVCILGGGPAGSSLATRLRQKNYSVVLFEKEQFPRFKIGESLLPASIPLLEEISFQKFLKKDSYIEKWGARFLKEDEEIYFNFQNGFNPKIPFAYEVERAVFDYDLLEHARQMGAHCHLNEKIESIDFSEKIVTLKSSKRTIQSRYVADATGRQSFLGKKYNGKKLKKFFNSFAVFAHFEGIPRAQGKHEGDITIVVLPNLSWMWMIPFKNGKCSVGLVCGETPPKNTCWEDFLFEKSMDCPRVYEALKGAKRCSDFGTASNYSHECDSFWGPRHLLVGDAALFMDPCFSSGVHTALQSAQFAAKSIDEAFQNNLSSFDINNVGNNYETLVRKGIQRFHALIDIFYKPSFVSHMKKSLSRKHVEAAFTSAIAGDMWNDENILFKKGVL